MLTPSEFEQLKASLLCMHVFTINGRNYVDQANVIALLCRWVEGWRPPRPHPENVRPDEEGQPS